MNSKLEEQIKQFKENYNIDFEKPTDIIIKDLINEKDFLEEVGATPYGLGVTLKEKIEVYESIFGEDLSLLNYLKAVQENLNKHNYSSFSTSSLIDEIVEDIKDVYKNDLEDYQLKD